MIIKKFFKNAAQRESACERQRERDCVCVCSTWGRELGVRTSIAVVWTAAYLTSYSDYLTGFREPLSPPHRYHTGLKTV